LVVCLKEFYLSSCHINLKCSWGNLTKTNTA
jgi:hypothetical protein